MLAVSAIAANADDPLAALEVGDRPEPEPAEGWELVDLRAASLNHHDLWSLRGQGLPEDRLPMILGCDLAGTTADGREVIAHAVITEPDGTWSLFSERHQGTLSERVAVPTRNLVDKPADLSWEEAACLPTAWLTAYRMLFTRGRAKPGERVLIQGAGGGLATAAILLARAAGLEVVVTSRDEERLQRALDLGAHEGVASNERLARRVDLVLESVGEATWKHSTRSLNEGGRIVVSGGTSGLTPTLELAHVFFRELEVIGATMGTADELARVVDMLRVTGIRPVIDSARPLSQARDAFERMLAGEEYGKLVLTRG
jgi:NADPH:quinone reductase-like Zn-dependent oxidoreductase